MIDPGEAKAKLIALSLVGKGKLLELVLERS